MENRLPNKPQFKQTYSNVWLVPLKDGHVEFRRTASTLDAFEWVSNFWTEYICLNHSVQEFMDWCNTQKISIYNYTYSNSNQEAMKIAEALSQFSPDIQQKIKTTLIKSG